MTRINLLPWRETHRIASNNRYFFVLGICLSIAAATGFAGFKHAAEKVAFQEKRNGRLNNEIVLLQEQLKEIEALEETKRNLLARMEIILQLQGQRPQIVHTFYEIASRLPDGTYLTSMKQDGTSSLQLEGKADSNARVSALMRRMDRSDYFKNPQLNVIQTSSDDSISSFKLSVVQDMPTNELESDDGI